MRNVKFAAITSSLLARKGEARPWIEPETGSSLKGEKAPSLEPVPRLREAVSGTVEKLKSVARRKDKKSAVRMSLEDYERLGIIAVKKGTTRQNLLQEALARLLAEESQRYAQTCSCLRTGAPSCGSACQD